MPRKDSSIPLRSVSTVNPTSQSISNAALLNVSETPEPPMPDISGIDFNVLFQSNSE